MSPSLVVGAFVSTIILLNVIVLVLFSDRTVPDRLHSPVSFPEVQRVVRAIEHDERQTVVFLGASAMWGAVGIDDPQETIPWVVADAFDTEQVGVYNLSFPSARPLDVLLLMDQLQEVADLFVVDINIDYLDPERGRNVRDDRTKYNRLQRQLTTRWASAQNIPGLDACLEAERISVQREIDIPAYQWIPMLRYKDEMNDQLFGQPYVLFIQSVLDQVLSFFKPGAREGQSDAVDVWGYTVDPIEPTINSCFSKVLAQAGQEHKKTLFYLSPYAPVIAASEENSIVFQQNLREIEQLYAGAMVVATGTLQLPQEVFVDRIHVNAVGHAAVAELLVPEIEKMLRTE